MAKGKLLNIFNTNLESDDDFSHIQKEVKRDKKTKSNKNISYKSDSNQILAPKFHLLFFRKEKRRGKIITMVGYFQLSIDNKKELLKQLKKSLATGGAIKENFLEFQGEVTEKLKQLLINKNFKFR